MWQRLGFFLSALVAFPLLGVVAALVCALGPTSRPKQIMRGWSRALCGIVDGDGDCTFSAMSAHLARKGVRSGVWREWCVDRLPGNYVGHCEEARLWHEEHGLFNKDSPG